MVRKNPQLIGRGARVTSSSSDPCLYVRDKSSIILIIALYVDDLLIAGSSKSEIAAIKGEFRKRFEMKRVGPAQVMLGLEIKRDSSTRRLLLSQPTYAEAVLKRVGMATSYSARTPMKEGKASAKKSAEDESMMPAKDMPVEISGTDYRFYKKY